MLLFQLPVWAADYLNSVLRVSKDLIRVITFCPRENLKHKSTTKDGRLRHKYGPVANAEAPCLMKRISANICEMDFFVGPSFGPSAKLKRSNGYTVSS